MGSHKTWSISLGDWGGVHVRLHSLFLLFAAFTLLLGWQAKDQAIAASSLGILLASVILHELGHYLAAIRLGGSGNEVILGPLGGLSSMRPPLDPLAEAGMHVAGPCVNLSICFITGAIAIGMQESPLALLNPLAPGNLIADESVWRLACKLTFWVNWLLFLVNLLPAFPFDGGRALRAALMSFRPERGARQASLTVATIAKMTAVALLVAAFVSMKWPAAHQTVVPTWFALMLLAIFLYFSAKQEAERNEELPESEEPFGYDFSQGYTSLERSQQRTEESVGPVQKWLTQRKEARLQRQREVEAEEEARVDDILSRLHAHGIESLSDEDRSLLQRVSARYRGKGV